MQRQSTEVCKDYFVVAFDVVKLLFLYFGDCPVSLSSCELFMSNIKQS